ncbi:MAG: site-specific integrase [Bacillota bacterium]
MRRHRGQIIPRGENCFLIRVFQGYEQDETGKCRRKYHSETYHGPLKQAERHLTKILREMDQGTFTEPSRETLNHYLDRWLAVAAKPRVSGSTYHDYEWLLKTYVRPVLGQRRLSQVKPLDVQTLYTKMQEQGLSARTIRYTHAVLRNAFAQAVKWQVLPQNPTQHVDLPGRGHKEMQCLSEVQAQRFLEAAQNDPYYPLFLLAITTGMRPGEYLALRWEDINFEAGTLSVQRTLVKRSGKHIADDSGTGWCFKEPKTSKSRRLIKLPHGVVQALRAHRTKQAEQRLSTGSAYRNLGLVFAGEEGQPLDEHNLVRRHFKPILREAGLPESVRLYDLRHTCATLLLAAGENPKIVSERLGHASVTLTLDTYSHVLPDMQQGAADKLQTMFFRK